MGFLYKSELHFFSFVASGEKELQWQGLKLAVVFLQSAGRRSAGSAQVEIVTGQKPTSPDLDKFYTMGFDCHLLLRSSHCHHFYHLCHHFWHYCHSHNQSSFCQFCFLYLDWLEFLCKCIGYGLNWHINNTVLTNHPSTIVAEAMLIVRPGLGLVWQLFDCLICLGIHWIQQKLTFQSYHDDQRNCCRGNADRQTGPWPGEVPGARPLPLQVTTLQLIKPWKGAFWHTIPLLTFTILPLQTTGNIPLKLQSFEGMCW